MFTSSQLSIAVKNAKSYSNFILGVPENKAQRLHAIFMQYLVVLATLGETRANRSPLCAGTGTVRGWKKYTFLLAAFAIQPALAGAVAAVADTNEDWLSQPATDTTVADTNVEGDWLSQPDNVKDWVSQPATVSDTLGSPLIEGHEAASFSRRAATPTVRGRQLTTAVTDSASFESAIVDHFDNAETVYGGIGTWDTSAVDTMENAFQFKDEFNGDLSGWDTSSVTNMNNMFDTARDFNSDVSNWDTSLVEVMTEMFDTASTFNGDVSTWDTANVADFNSMFLFANLFNADVSQWDTSRAINMGKMLSQAKQFNVDLSAWDTSRVEDFEFTFLFADGFNNDLSGWDTSSAITMKRTFFFADAFNADISGWDTARVTDFNKMFSKAPNFNADLSGWDTATVTDFAGMFEEATNFNADISGWDTASVTDFTEMFKEATNFDQILRWDTSLGWTTTGDMFKDSSGSLWTASPTTSPTSSPTANPTSSPTTSPTSSPTANPTSSPTTSPTSSPTANPTSSPTTSPTSSPTANPTSSPTASPTASPTTSPTSLPTANPTHSPTASPTTSPTSLPTANPTHSPTLSGDPHLVGFLGQRFDLVGRPQSVYRFIEDDRLQMSVLIDTPAFEHSTDVQLRASDRHAGLFMLGVELAFLDNAGQVVEVSVRADFNSTVHHDPRYCGPNAGTTGCLRGLQAQVNGGSPISHATDELRLGQDAALTSFNTGCNFNQRAGCTSKAANGGNAVFTLTTPSIDVDVGAVLRNNHLLMEKNLHHLDLDVSKYRPSGKPGGLLGQTVEYRLDKDGQPITKGAGSIEGYEDDYIIIPQSRAPKLKNSPFNAGRAFAASVDGDKVV